MSPPRRLAYWRKGKGGRRGGEDGVPEPPAGVPADPAGQPRLHYRLRPHHRGRGEQLWRHVLFFRLAMTGSSENGFGPQRSPEGLVPGVGGDIRS